MSYLNEFCDRSTRRSLRSSTDATVPALSATLFTGGDYSNASVERDFHAHPMLDSSTGSFGSPGHLGCCGVVESGQSLSPDSACSMGSGRSSTEPGLRQSSAPKADQSPMRAQLLEYCKLLERRVEQQEEVIQQVSAVQLQSELESRDSQLQAQRAEAEVGFAETALRKKEASFQEDIAKLQAERRKERDHLRGEVKRLSMSYREAKDRERKESEGRATSVESLQRMHSELSTAREEIERRGREGKEARSVLAMVEQRLDAHMNLFHWVAAQCMEAANAAGHDDILPKSILGSNGGSGGSFEDGLKQIVSRTLAKLKQPLPREEVEKENRHLQEVPLPSPQAPAPETVLRLAEVQKELLRVHAENEALEASQRVYAAKLLDAERESERSVSARSGSRTPGLLRTQERDRLRTAERQKQTLEETVNQLEAKLADQSQMHDDEMRQIKCRLAALQRTKEAGERYVASEEDTWLALQQQSERLEVEVSETCAELLEAHEELSSESRALSAAEARSEHLATVEATCKADAKACHSMLRAEEATAHRREEELELMVHHGQAEIDAMLQRRECASARFEVAVQTDRITDIPPIGGDGPQMEQPMASASEVATLEAELAKSNEAYRVRQQSFERTLEERQEQQARIDEAKRHMVRNAMSEQARTLRTEFQGLLEAEVQRSKEELAAASKAQQAQQSHLDHARQSLASFRRKQASLEAELQLARSESSEVAISKKHDSERVVSEELAALQARLESYKTDLRNERRLAEVLRSEKEIATEEAHELRLAYEQVRMSKRVSEINEEDYALAHNSARKVVTSPYLHDLSSGKNRTDTDAQLTQPGHQNQEDHQSLQSSSQGPAKAGRHKEDHHQLGRHQESHHQDQEGVEGESPSGSEGSPSGESPSASGARSRLICPTSGTKQGPSWPCGRRGPTRRRHVARFEPVLEGEDEDADEEEAEDEDVIISNANVQVQSLSDEGQMPSLDSSLEASASAVLAAVQARESWRMQTYPEAVAPMDATDGRSSVEDPV